MAQQCSRHRRGNAARDSPVRVGHTVDGGATGVYCTSVRSSSRAYTHLWGGRLGHTGWLANTSFQRGRGWRFIWIREWGDARPRVWAAGHSTSGGAAGIQSTSGVYSTSTKIYYSSYTFVWSWRRGYTGGLADPRFRRRRGWKPICIRWGDGVGDAGGACCTRLDDPHGCVYQDDGTIG